MGLLAVSDWCNLNAAFDLERDLPKNFRSPFLQQLEDYDNTHFHVLGYFSVFSHFQALLSETRHSFVSPPLFTMAAQAPPTTTGSVKLDGAVQKMSANEPKKLSGLALYSRFVRTSVPTLGIIY